MLWTETVKAGGRMVGVRAGLEHLVYKLRSQVLSWTQWEEIEDC